MSKPVTCDDIQWRRVNDEPFEYAIQQGPNGDEFVKLLNGTCLRRPMTSPAQTMTELADEFAGWVEKYGQKVCPDGCLPTISQEREINLFARLGAALREPVPQGVREALETARYVFEEFMPSGPLVNDALKKIKAALFAVSADGREALESAADWCETEGNKIGAIDGYDYRSGEEFGLRRAAIELKKRAALASAPVTEGREALIDFERDLLMSMALSINGLAKIGKMTNDEVLAITNKTFVRIDERRALASKPEAGTK